MTVSLKHAFTSNVADSSDASLVQPSNWNAEHTLTAGADTLLGAVTAGAVTEITCTSAGRALLDDADAAAQRTTLSAAGTGVTNTFTANQIISVTDNTNAALRVTQLGTGNAILVEDSTNPDSTPFVVKASGLVGIGNTDPSEALEVTGNILSETSVSTGNSPVLSLINTSGSTLGAFGPSVLFDNSVANTHGFIVGQFQGTASNFYISNAESPYTQFFVVDQSGYVGINAQNPEYYLDVTASDNVTTTSAVSIQNAARNYGLGLGAYQLTNRNIGGVATTVDYTFDIGGAAIFSTGGSERMRIASGGNVSIGNADTTYPLHLFRNSGEVRFLVESGTTGQDTYINFANASYGGSDFLVGLAGAAANSYVWDRSTGRDIIFGTANTERMRIDSAGGVTVAGVGSGVGNGLVVANGDLAAYRTGGTTGAVYLNSAATAYLYWSGTTYTLGGSGDVITTGNGQAWIGGLSVGAVGTYAFLRFATLTAAAAGSTHAGSGLRYTNASGSVSGTPSGTWRLMGDTGSGSNAASSSVFLRIS